MIVSTCPTIEGTRVVKTIGIVRGSTVRGIHLGKDLLAVMRNWVGGEIEEYTKMLAEAREHALDRLIDSARQLGANAVLVVRYSASDIAAGAAEILIYGTAVVIEEGATDATRSAENAAEPLAGVAEKVPHG